MAEWTSRTASVSIDIDAPPERVWGLVSDVTQMGRFSPECRKCVWRSGSGPVPGATFVGFNRRGPVWWATVGHVEESEPGRVFSFHTTQLVGGRTPITRWRYTFEPNGSGTRVTESWELLHEIWLTKLGRVLFGDRASQLEDGMRRTLERIKQAAES